MAEGFFDFATGQVLTAQEMDDVASQTVMRFADATARDAAITSPSEGYTVFLKDVDRFYYYDGAAWVVAETGMDLADVGSSALEDLGDVTITSVAASEVIQWNGSAWVNAALGGGALSLNVQSFTASGTWTKPAGAAQVRVIVVGGGGSGAAGGTGGDGDGTGGGGGGCRLDTGWLDADTFASSETVTVASGAAAQTATGTAGNTGGTSSFGDFDAYGGGGGGWTTNPANYAHGGTGGGSLTAGYTPNSDSATAYAGGGPFGFDWPTSSGSFGTDDFFSQLTAALVADTGIIPGAPSSGVTSINYRAAMQNALGETVNDSDYGHGSPAYTGGASGGGGQINGATKRGPGDGGQGILGPGGGGGAQSSTTAGTVNGGAGGSSGRANFVRNTGSAGGGTGGTSGTPTGGTGSDGDGGAGTAWYESGHGGGGGFSTTSTGNGNGGDGGTPGGGSGGGGHGGSSTRDSGAGGDGWVGVLTLVEA